MTLARTPYARLSPADIGQVDRELKKLEQMSAGLYVPKVLVAARSPYTVQGTDTMLLCDCTAGPVTLTFPLAARVEGMTVVVVKSDTSANAVTLSGTFSGAVNPQITVQHASYTVSAMNSVYHVTAGVTYPEISGETGVTNMLRYYGDPRRHGGVGDQTTNDTVAVQAAVTSCLATSYPLVVNPLLSFAVTSVTAIGTSGAPTKLCIVGGGRGISQIVRHSSALTTQTDLLQTLWCDLEMSNVGFDHKWSGAAGSTKACVSAYKATRIDVTACSFKNGQYHGLNLAACDHIVVTGNEFDHCYYSGCSVGGGLISGADVPYGSTAVTITNNHFTFCYGGPIVQVYVYDLTVANNTLRQSSIQIGQPCFRVNVASNTVYQSNTTFGAGLTNPAPDGIFLESPSDCAVTGNVIVSVAGNGIYATGSEIHTVPSGPNEGILPLLRTWIRGNQVYGAAATGILVTARSTNAGFPGTPNVNGSDCSVQHNAVLACAVGIVFDTCNGGMVSGNYIARNNTHGLTLDASQFLHVTGNTVKNNSQTSVGTYHGVVLSQGAFRNLIESNDIYDDQGSTTQGFGIYDNVLDTGTASLTLYKNNTFYGNRAAAIFPVPVMPTLGTWVAGDWFDVPSPVVGKPTRFRCIVAGTPGTWIGEALVVGISADKGNADATLTAGVSETTTRFGTALTADRSCNLSNTGAWPGAKFRIIRQNGATGAFNVNVKNGAAITIKALASASTWGDFEYDATFGWFVVASGSL